MRHSWGATPSETACLGRYDEVAGVPSFFGGLSCGFSLTGFWGSAGLTTSPRSDIASLVGVWHEASMQQGLEMQDIREQEMTTKPLGDLTGVAGLVAPSLRRPATCG
jgi:hypothetical protein